MKILILDDDKDHLKLFKQKLIGHAVECAETAHKAIELLEKNGQFDQIFLDHDLSGFEHQPSGKNTGYEVAEWVSEHDDKRPFRIVIHSFNVQGAQNILTLLPEASYLPGVWLLNRMEF